MKLHASRNMPGPTERHNRVVWLGSKLGENSDNNQFRFSRACMPTLRAPRLCSRCLVSPKAISKNKETGVVTVNEDACVGCGECVTACPYGAMGFDPDGRHAVECDLCSDRRAEGAATTVRQFAQKAITFGPRDDS